jgi:hypothetical protein
MARQDLNKRGSKTFRYRRTVEDIKAKAIKGNKDRNGRRPQHPSFRHPTTVSRKPRTFYTRTPDSITRA